MKSSILLICVAFVGAFSCAPKEWEVMQSDVSEGVFLSMAQDGDKLLLVGGQSDQGQVWSTSDEGATLELEPIPNVSLLTWLHVFDDGDVICAGLNGQILWREGENRRADNVGLDAELWGVWAASKNDVWAVGGLDRWRKRVCSTFQRRHFKRREHRCRRRPRDRAFDR